VSRRVALHTPAWRARPTEPIPADSGTAEPVPAPVRGHRLGESFVVEARPQPLQSRPSVAQSPAALALQRTAATEPAPIQRIIEFTEDDREFKTKRGKDTNGLIRELKDLGATSWKSGWIGDVRDMASDKSNTHTYDDVEDCFQKLEPSYVKTGRKRKRPNFSSTSYKLAKGTHGLKTGKDEQDLSLIDNDLAMPHRMSYADIRDNVHAFVKGKDSASDLTRWTDRLLVATEQRKKENLLKDKKGLLPKDYEDKVDKQITAARVARKGLISAVKNGIVDEDALETYTLIKCLNNLHGNIPDLGPHNTVNVPVSRRAHLNYPPSPGTNAVMAMSPKRVSGIAVTKDKKNVVSTGGFGIPISEYGSNLDHFELEPTTLSLSDLEEWEDL